MKTEAPKEVKVEPYFIRQSHVRALFDINRKILVDWRKQGLLNPVKFKGTVLYDRKEIVDLLNRYRVRKIAENED
jgi:predicted site-specific integrase-resolvase